MKEGPDSAIALLSKDGGCSLPESRAGAAQRVIASGLPDEVRVRNRPTEWSPIRNCGFNSISSGTDHFLVRSYFYLGTDYQTTSQKGNYPIRVSRPGSRKRTPVDPGGKRHFTGTERSQP
jgi:hypothetical protein